MSHDIQRITMRHGASSGEYVLGPLAGLELPRHAVHGPPVWLVDARVATLHPTLLQDLQAGSGHAPDPARVLAIDGGEGAKTPARLAEVWEWLARTDLPRDGLLVGVGGGTVLDLAGFAAATWRRGVDWVAFPTTLLAMVDAAIGGKTAVNAAGIKNPVGAFHPPRAVLADCAFLGSLPRRHWRAGLAETVKTAVIGEPRLYADLWNHRDTLDQLLCAGDRDLVVPGVLANLPWRDWIGRAARTKADIVAADPREKGQRRALNLGHTLGHVLESWTATTDDPLDHGQAVSIGMAVVFRVAAERGVCPLPVALQVIQLLKRCGLPVRCAAPPRERIERLLAGDKKSLAASGLRWVLPEGIGRVRIDAQVTLDELVKWLD
jgi:3-dehydroquinate synthase